MAVNRVILLAMLLAACASGPASEPAPEPAPEAAPVQSESIDATLERHAERLLAIEGIQGIYVGATEDGDPCLVIMATVPAEDLADAVGDSLEGWPVKIESGDEIRPMN
jgi:hypothetical protein